MMNIIKKAFKFMDKLFGETLEYDASKIYLPVFFTVMLCTTTLFFFDHKTFNLLGYPVHFPLGLIVFPLTFTIANLIQERYGRLYANTTVRYAFIADLTLVCLGYVLSRAGDRDDYLSVYKQIPVIMLLTFFTIWLSNLINTLTFEVLKEKKLHDFIKFSVAAIIAETSVSMISIPLMMHQNKLTGSALLSVIVSVTYKMTVTIILSSLIATKNYLSNRHQGQDHNLL